MTSQSTPPSPPGKPARSTQTPTPGYHWSPLTREHVDPWATLVNHLATVDGTEEFYSPGDLAEEFDSPKLDPQRDLVAIWAEDQMVGFGQVSVSENVDNEGRARCWLNGGVHADHRRRGLGRQLAARLEGRAAESVAERHPDAGFYWQVSGGRAGSTAEQMFRSRGYQIVRYFSVLIRPVPAVATPASASGGTTAPALTSTAPASPMVPHSTAPHPTMHSTGTELPPLPPQIAGVTFRPVAPTDSERVLAAHRVAFADHWGSIPGTDDAWAQRWNAASNRLQVSTVAVDEQGTVLSYVLCGQWLDRELYINLVATRPDHRGRGLARAALLHTLHRAAASGAYDAVELEVDSESPTGATRLYENLGFVHKFTTSTLRKNG